MDWSGWYSRACLKGLRKPTKTCRDSHCPDSDLCREPSKYEKKHTLYCYECHCHLMSSYIHQVVNTECRKLLYKNVKFEVLTVVSMRNHFWVVTQSLGGKYCLNIHAWLSFLSWKERRYFPPKRQVISELHGFTTQKVLLRNFKLPLML
jgi:hypothetical protein